MEDQPHYVDLIPKRLGVYWAFFILSILAILGFEYLYIEMPKIAEKMGVEYIAAFDLEQSGSLSTWYISILWFLSGIICIQNFLFTVRNSKLGKYADVWVWGAIGSIFMSLDTSAHLRLLIRDVMIYLSGTAVLADGTIWWIGIYFIISGMIGTRILAEMRHYLPSCNAFFMAGLGYILAVCIELKLIDVTGLHSIITNSVMVRVGLEMLANVFLVLSFSLYARHLIFLADPTAFSKWYAGLWKRDKKKSGRIISKTELKEPKNDKNTKDSRVVTPTKPVNTVNEKKDDSSVKDAKDASCTKEAEKEKGAVVFESLDLPDDNLVTGAAAWLNLNKDKAEQNQKGDKKKSDSSQGKQDHDKDSKVSKYVFKSR